MKNIFRIIFPIVILLLSVKTGSSQQTMHYKDPEASYFLAQELYEKEKYGAAQEIFDNISVSIKEIESDLKTNSTYYSAMCASELQNGNAQTLLEGFIKNYPESIHNQKVFFELGDLFYRNKDYSDALKVFEKVNRRQLDAEQISEYYFKKGYCYMKAGKNKKAQDTFSEIIDKESKYRGPANYYYAHIAYLEEDYETALNGFLKLTEDKTFRSVVPYYIIQIYYINQQYEEVIQMAESLPKKENKRTYEVAMMVGNSYFQLGDYESSLPYLEKYINKSRSKVTREGWYQVGFAYYMTAYYEDAIKAFQKTTSPKDSLAQYAYYMIGDCYLSTGQKQYAQNAFLSSFKIEANLGIKEESLFNYAKLAYELSYDPYNEAITALRQYISDYPESARLDEAYTYLLNLFMSTNNFKEALESIENIKQKDDNLKKAYQQISHYRGIEIFNNRDYNGAITLFRRSLDYDYDRTIYSANLYWIAECHYRLAAWDQAINYYKKFLNTSSAKSFDYYELANYNIGYAYFTQKNYVQAKTYFRRFTGSTYPDARFISDAHLRTGDCYFIEKSYDEAINQYDRAILRGGPDKEYATFQKAVTYGGKGNFGQKATLLRDFIYNYPGSTYIDDAAYELGTTYLIMNREDEALIYFKKIIDQHPNSKHVKRSLLKVGLIYYGQDNSQAALSTLKIVVEKYPGSTESKEALKSIQNIYVDMNNVDEYFAYTKNISFADVSVNERDSLTYYAAENKYMEGDCDRAIPGFAGYIDQFQKGAFMINANYYKAECDLKKNNIRDALKGYLFVISHPSSRFTENALLKASVIEYNLNNYDTALVFYKMLERTASNKNNSNIAQVGKMRCNFLLGYYSETIEDANEILNSGWIDDELAVEAHFTVARSAMFGGDLDLALKEFRKTCEKSQAEEAAESQYHIAAILYEKGKYKEAEDEVFKLINTYPSYDYWLARGFILLADIYVMNENIFQAKQTLISIIENYEGPDLGEMAQDKLNAILIKERLEQESLETEAEEAEEDDF